MRLLREKNGPSRKKYHPIFLQRDFLKSDHSNTQRTVAASSGRKPKSKRSHQTVFSGNGNRRFLAYIQPVSGRVSLFMVFNVLAMGFLVGYADEKSPKFPRIRSTSGDFSGESLFFHFFLSFTESLLRQENKSRTFPSLSFFYISFGFSVRLYFSCGDTFYFKRFYLMVFVRILFLFLSLFFFCLPWLAHEDLAVCAVLGKHPHTF